MTTVLIAGVALLWSMDTTSAAPEKLLFGFDKPEEKPQWGPLNDTVMGGVSRSRVEVTAKGTAVFTGELSLENNGGFASIRSKPADHNLKGYQGILLRVKGDGKRFKICLKLDPSLDGPLYQKDFTPKKDVWTTVRIPFDQLVPTYHGRVLRDYPPLDPTRIKSFTLMIADKQAGLFRLEVDWIKAYAPAVTA